MAGSGRRQGGGAGSGAPLQGMRLFFVLCAVVVGVALLAGMLFSRTDPQRAASMLLGDQARAEPVGSATEAPAPTSGDKHGPPACGVSGVAVDVQVQVDALASGVVVVQYRDGTDGSAVVAAMEDLRDEVLVAPNPGLDDRVVATAWTRRLAVAEVNGPLLRAFVTAHGGRGPDAEACTVPE